MFFHVYILIDYPFDKRRDLRVIRSQRTNRPLARSDRKPETRLSNAFDSLDGSLVVVVDPLDHLRGEALQDDQQNEDQQEADNGVLQSALGLFSVLGFFRLGELRAEDDAVDGADGADQQDQRAEHVVQ